MNKRHPLVGRTGGDQQEIQARHAGLLRELAEGLQPTLCSDALACRSVVAEAYKAATDVDLDPFSLEDTVIIFVHKGVLEANLLYAGIRQTLSQGGLAVLPPAGLVIRSWAFNKR
jgi:hypothetical protein